MPSAALRVSAAAIVATIAFWAYSRTLVPGVEPGDSAAFQAAVLWPEITARQAYPLYYGLARPFVRAVSTENPARGLNLFSAVTGAIAVGLLTGITATIARSVPAGVAAGLLFAFSYTFWSQAIIAEVYTLHLLLIGLCLFALHGYASKPSTARLVIVFTVFALTFGNHLSTILLLPGFAAFIVMATPERRSLFRPHVVALGVVIAAAGALQYLPNMLAVWFSPDSPPTITARFAAFWFDVTKSDWREVMVLGIDDSQLSNRVGMWWFDARQQFGLPGAALMAAGAVAIVSRSLPWAAGLLLTWAVGTAFALTYNVGDAHVFFLPAHYVAAILAGSSVLLLEQRRLAVPLALAMIGYAGWRGWDTWPAVDRHDDRRGEQAVTRATAGLSSQSSTLVTQLDWQLENVLSYQTRYRGDDLGWRRLPDVLVRWPFYVQDAHARGLDVVLDDAAARAVIAGYGAAFSIVEDPLAPAPALADVVARIPRGTPYVLTWLPPPRDSPLSEEMTSASIAALTGGGDSALPAGVYRVMAGVAGEAPFYTRGEERPFRDEFRIVDEAFSVRMESWMATDSFRRAGFGHVLRGREHVLIIERGISLVSFAPDRRRHEPQYIAGLYSLRPRFRIPSAAPQLARAEP